LFLLTDMGHLPMLLSEKIFFNQSKLIRRRIWQDASGSVNTLQGSGNTITAATTNTITGGTGNTVTATTGNNVITATLTLNDYGATFSNAAGGPARVTGVADGVSDGDAVNYRLYLSLS